MIEINALIYFNSHKIVAYNSFVIIQRMATSQEGLSNEKLTALCSELTGLSGRYGNVQETREGYLVSNDEGYLEIDQNIKANLAEKYGGIGVFVGSGGLFSLLPDLPLDVAVLVDIDPSILKFHRMLEQKILESGSPEEVKSWLASEEIAREYPVINQLLDEADKFGELHWTNPARFQKVQNALRKRHVVYIAADVVNEEFGQALTHVADTYDEKIRFANFTNVHSYVSSGAMGILSTWPFDKNAAIIYSSKKDVELGHFSKMYLVNSAQEYIEEANKDPRS